MENKGAIRELAKLFLNNRYGKMASSTDSRYKIAGGSDITYYSICFTIRAARAAQANYGIENPGFIYVDTDSIHCDLTSEQIKGIKVAADYWLKLHTK